MSAKSKGTNGEREVIRSFWSLGWVAMRAAGSGSTHYPCPDIIAGKLGKRIVVECKVTAEKRKYFTIDEINQLVYFASHFGAEPFVAVKFPQKSWFFFTIEDLKKTENSYIIASEDCEIKGITIEHLTE